MQSISENMQTNSSLHMIIQRSMSIGWTINSAFYWVNEILL